jgi:hypothetical protein
MPNIKIDLNGNIVEMDSEDVSKAIEAGELKIETPDLQILKKSDENVIFSKDKFEEFKTNLSNEEYNKGKTNGQEMQIKEAREKHGLDFQGKTMENFAEAFKTKILDEAKVEPNETIKALEADKAKLQENFTTLQTDFDTYKSGVTEKETRILKDSTIRSLMPEKGLIVDNDIAMLALKNKAGIDISFEDNKPVLTVKGEVLKDQALNPIKDPKPIIEEKLKELNLMEKASGGAGGGDDTNNSSPGSYEAFVEEMKAKGIEENAQKFSIEMNKRIANKTLQM